MGKEVRMLYCYPFYNTKCVLLSLYFAEAQYCLFFIHRAMTGWFLRKYALRKWLGIMFWGMFVGGGEVRILSMLAASVQTDNK
jgi:hypothetical protein